MPRKMDSLIGYGIEATDGDADFLLLATKRNGTAGMFPGKSNQSANR
jgi:hypothetical protein